MRVAILGATGFGRFHAREFRRAGARVESILGSTPASAASTAALLRDDYGVEVRTRPGPDAEKTGKTLRAPISPGCSFPRSASNSWASSDA